MYLFNKSPVSYVKVNNRQQFHRHDFSSSEKNETLTHIILLTAESKFANMLCAQLFPYSSQSRAKKDEVAEVFLLFA